MSSSYAFVSILNGSHWKRTIRQICVPSKIYSTLWSPNPLSACSHGPLQNHGNELKSSWNFRQNISLLPSPEKTVFGEAHEMVKEAHHKKEHLQVSTIEKFNFSKSSHWVQSLYNSLKWSLFFFHLEPKCQPSRHLLILITFFKLNLFWSGKHKQVWNRGISCWCACGLGVATPHNSPKLLHIKTNEKEMLRVDSTIRSDPIKLSVTVIT